MPLVCFELELMAVIYNSNKSPLRGFFIAQ
ncbi:hypothetical protein [Citrobacter phage vB_CfrS_K1M]